METKNKNVNKIEAKIEVKNYEVINGTLMGIENHDVEDLGGDTDI